MFALTGFAARLAGPALTLAFLLNGFVAMFTAVSYAELGAAFPEAGGGYLWVKEALVDPNGFYAGWMSWFAHAVACSLYAVTFGVFLVELVVYSTGLPHEFHLLGFITPIMAEKGLSVLMVAAFAYINFRGAEETGKAGVIVTGIKVVILGAFIAFGIIGAMGFTYIAFEGYEIIVQSGEEVVDPGSNIPKAVFYSMLIVVPIYILVAFASIGGIDVTQRIIGLAEVGGQQNVYTWELLGELGELGIIRAAGQFMPYGVPLLLFAGLAATMSALNATVYSSSRVSFAMGRDRALPALFDNIHPEKRTPHWAIFISAILIAAMAVVLPIEAVAASADIMFIHYEVRIMSQDTNGRSNTSSPPDGLPDSLVEQLSELNEAELRTAISYARSLLPEPPTVEDLLEERSGERILEVEDREGYTKVVKTQPCAKGCDDCPHGPYLYHVRVEKHPEQGEESSLHWKFIGPVH